MNTNIMWKVVIEDLTHLGGPMGTEYTTIIDTKIFSTKEKAIEFIKEYEKKWGELPSPYIEKEDFIRWDCLSHGFTLKTVEVDEE